MQQGPDPRYPYNPYAAPTYDVIAPAPRDAYHALLADRWTRFGGRFIDNLLIGGTCLPVLAAMAMGHESDAWLVTAIIPICFIAYQCYLVATTGQSVAKKWLGMRIVRMDGSPVGFGAGVFLREWVTGLLGFVPLVGLLVRLVDSAMIFGEERRCLHDLIAGTKVIVVV
jgi:uncharacterized RDD family membrane protein YckC